ncbi:MAG: hypothetical protein DI598_00045 [Pseudopedobacter saltans]|uniref:FAD-binding FR-type domain-containing protein n=1 Tax=Pseudopedobacter saltans TaxID=151895 RepID=A0A2W5F9B5_9SPHI|nr:MAG: hypothetical protein DI598_00045 [Pseudopedobacter saltans]
MNYLKRQALNLLEKRMLRRGSVLDVRLWSPATICEIDLYLPDADMSRWDSVQHIKMKVADATYRDYTPVYWDAETHTCTLILDLEHGGPGTDWAKMLTKNISIEYIGIGKTPHRPVSGTMLGFGDVSAMAHLLALEYLAKEKSNITGGICFRYPNHALEFSEYFKSNYQPIVLNENTAFHDKWEGWLENHTLLAQTVFVVGNIPSVVKFRKFLKSHSTFNGNIKAEGFWQ